MIRNKKVLKVLSIFFMANLLLNVILPSAVAISTVLAGNQQTNAGINPPEIVDLKTGDMNYSVPLIDLPGGYSFDLSYHAGVQPSQYSSWIGLGWHMEAGEITRTVNGYPDDYKGPTYEKYYYGTTLPSSPTKQFKPYGCLQGYSMTSGKTAGDSLPDNVAFDTYTSHYPDTFETANYYSFSEPIEYLQPQHGLNSNDSYFGGSFPNYDGYAVSGGADVNGFIQPLILENPTLYHASRNSALNYRASVVQKPFAQAKPCFRYINDFSNSYKASSIASFTSTDTDLSPITIDFGSNALGYQYTTNSDGFNSSNMRLAGSRHVEYYTNEEIADATSSGARSKGFIGYEGKPNTTARNTASFASGTYSYNVEDQIGGFSITDANGNTYHYALPVYSYKKYDYTLTADEKETANDVAQAFAYKWLLTTITGPDFVDRNSNGYADENDWGNWTNFAYGRWEDQFDERSPWEGRFKTQNGSEIYSKIKKEVYYLDAAYTRSHIILFAKDSRTDGYGISNGISLRLRSALLFTTESIKNLCSLLSFSSTTTYGNIVDIKEVNSSGNFEAVIDKTDLDNMALTQPYAPYVIRETKLIQDYSLCTDAPTSNAATGKLTLNSVSYYGRNGSQSSPNYDFYYELSSPYARSGVVLTHTPGDAGFGTRRGRIDCGSTANNFQLGDIVKFTVSSVTYYAVLTKGLTWYSINNALYDVVFLGPNIPGNSKEGISTTATQTKNPPYTEDYYDVWGNLKSDYDYTPNLQNASHKTSPVSAAGVDCWSLRKISTPTGATIEVEYESDTYSDIAASDGKRVLNVHPNIGFKPTSGSSNYTNLVNDGTYYFGLNFKMSHVNASLTSHDFKLRFLEPDAVDAVNENVTTGQTVQMVSACKLHKSGDGTNTFFTKTADVTVSAKGSDANGAYMIVSIPRHDQTGGLPFVEEAVTNFTHTVHLGSHLIIGNKKMLRYGGGLRVKSVTLKGAGSYSTYKTTYDYNKRTLSHTSGSVAYDPGEYDLIDKVTAAVADNYPYTINGSTSWGYEKLIDYRATYAYLLNPFEAIRYFVPSPEVCYEFVAVKNSGNDVTESTYREYQYNVFRNSMIDRQVPLSQAYKSMYYLSWYGATMDSTTHRFNVRSEFKDFTSRAGLLLAVNTLDLNNKVVSRQAYHYSDEATLPADQGVVGQVFHEYRKGMLFRQETDWIGRLATNKHVYEYTTVSSFHRYPTVLLNIESTNYLKGLSDTVEFKAYDLYNGSATEIITKDSYGNAFKRKIVPAYRYANSSGVPLGLMMSGYRNMIAATGEEYVYRVDPANYDTHLGTMAGNVTQWAIANKYRQYNSGSGLYEDVTVTDNSGTVQNETVFRPAKVYSWSSPKVNTDGSFNSFIPYLEYNPPAGWTTHANWKLEVAQLVNDPYSGLLSATDVDGNYFSKKLTKKKSMVLAETGNCNYNSFTYTSFEDYNDESAPNTYSYLDGEVKAGYSPSTGVTNAKTLASSAGISAHTGKYVCKVVNAQEAPSYTAKTISGDASSLQPGKTYRASVWVHESSPASAALIVSVDGSTGAGAYSASYSRTMSQATVKCGSWYLLNLDIDIPSDYVSTGGAYNKVLVTLSTNTTNSYFDDLSFHPLDSDLKGYVYDELTWQLTHVLDKDNFYTRYEYDNNNRLKALYRETVNGEVKIQENKYNLVK